MTAIRISGRVASGAGEGATFTTLDWARRLFLSNFGIDPHPGTFNLHLADAEARGAWSRLLETEGTALPAPDRNFCDARGFMVQINDQLAAAAIVPEVPGYPDDKIELIAAVPLRSELQLADGDAVEISSEPRREIDALIVDVDGTLINSLDGYMVVAERVAAARGWTVSKEIMSEALNYRRSFWDIMIPDNYPRHDSLVDELRAETMAHWPAVMDEHVGPFEGLAATLERCRQSGIRLAIYTGSQGESLSALEKAGLLDWFDPVVTATDVRAPKPHPEGIQRALTALAVAPERAAYFGDTDADMRAARAAGVYAIGSLTGAADSATLTRAGAHRIVESHAGLLPILGV